MRYVGFLRGINVGGKMVKMEELRKLFESLNFKNVKTLLNSGNIIFETDQSNSERLTQLLEQKLEEKFGFKIDILLRTFPEIQQLIDSNPFNGIEVTPQTRLYVTFLSEGMTSNLKIPYESPEKDFKILSVSPSYVISMLTLSPARGTTEAMNILAKEFGKRITTRNWNTIVKIGKL